MSWALDVAVRGASCGRGSESRAEIDRLQSQLRRACFHKVASIPCGNSFELIPLEQLGRPRIDVLWCVAQRARHSATCDMVSPVGTDCYCSQSARKNGINEWHD